MRQVKLKLYEKEKEGGVCNWVSHQCNRVDPFHSAFCILYSAYQSSAYYHHPLYLLISHAIQSSPHPHPHRTIHIILFPKFSLPITIHSFTHTLSGRVRQRERDWGYQQTHTHPSMQQRDTLSYLLLLQPFSSLSSPPPLLL